MKYMGFKANTTRYDHMEYNRCGNSGLKLSALSLGLWHNFGGIDRLENSREMILGAFDLGITHFDLANNYGPPAGSAEETFGKILSDDLKSYRDEIVVSTKAGYYMWPGPYGEWGSRKNLLASLDQSLHRMGLDYVDIFYHHRPDPNTPLEETMGALVTAIKQGKALYIGVSNYSPEDIMKANTILKGMGHKLLISQPKYSMFNRIFEQTQQKLLLSEGIGAVAFCPLAEGMLTNKYFSGIPSDSRAAGPSVFLTNESITAERIEKAKKLDVLAKKRNQSLAQFALAWALNNPAMTSLIIGASRLSQIKENVMVINNQSFTIEELTAINEILKDSTPF